jgi:hypothetical protein
MDDPIVGRWRGFPFSVVDSSFPAPQPEPAGKPQETSDWPRGKLSWFH